MATPDRPVGGKHGFPYKKGQIIRVPGQDGVYEVARDVEWNSDFNWWGSVWLVGQDVPLFTHKGAFDIVGDVDKALWDQVSSESHIEACNSEIAEEVRRRKLSPADRAAEDRADQIKSRSIRNPNRGGGLY